MGVGGRAAALGLGVKKETRAFRKISGESRKQDPADFSRSHRAFCCLGGRETQIWVESTLLTESSEEPGFLKKDMLVFKCLAVCTEALRCSWSNYP